MRGFRTGSMSQRRDKWTVGSADAPRRLHAWHQRPSRTGAGAIPVKSDLELSSPTSADLADDHRAAWPWGARGCSGDVAMVAHRDEPTLRVCRSGAPVGSVNPSGRPEVERASSQAPDRASHCGRPVANGHQGARERVRVVCSDGAPDMQVSRRLSPPRCWLLTGQGSWATPPRSACARTSPMGKTTLPPSHIPRGFTPASTAGLAPLQPPTNKET